MWIPRRANRIKAVGRCFAGAGEVDNAGKWSDNVTSLFGAHHTELSSLTMVVAMLISYAR